LRQVDFVFDEQDSHEGCDKGCVQKRSGPF
jgi:hypothetical protein